MEDYANQVIDIDENAEVYAESVLELDDDEIREEQLGPHKNISEEHLHLPREVVTEIDRKRILVHVTCLKPQLVEYEKHQGCLIVLQLAFVPKLNKSRPKRATVEVDFIDHTVDTRNPHQVNSANDEQRLHRPKVIAFEPRQFEGVVDRRNANKTIYAEISGGNPTGFGGVSTGVKLDSPSIKEASRRVIGTQRGSSGSVVFWTLIENKLTSQGVFPSFNLPIVTTYTTGRRFGARIRITVDLAFGNLLYLKCGKMDDPIFVDPDKVRESCQTDKAIVREDLRRMSKLQQYEGRFLD